MGGNGHVLQKLGEGMTRLCAVMLALLTFGSASARAQEWWPARVELSDGTQLQGRVSVTGDGIVILNESQARRYTVRPAEMARLETVIERQAMEEKWLFPQSGRDDKVYTGQTYPVRQYLTRITFHDGRVLEGYAMPRTFYVETDAGRQRLALRRKDEGKVGQALNDLVYVRLVEFRPEGSGVRGTIEGTFELPQGERLQRVLALNRNKLFAVEGTFSPSAGSFRFTDCTEGTYDLLAVTDKTVYAFFSRERDAQAGRLNDKQVAAIQAWVDKLRDFFHEQTILCGAGNDERAFVLVRQERHGGTTLEGAALVRRYEVWAMHKPAEEWQIEKRIFVQRLVSEQASVPRRAVYLVPELGGHKVSAEVSSLTLQLRLAPNADPLIPPAPEEPARGD